MAEKKSKGLPPGWSVVDRDVTTPEPKPEPEPVENTGTISPATEREVKALERLREAMKNLEQRIADGKIYALGFVYIGPDATGAGYGWSGGADEYPTQFLANIDLLRADYFGHWQDMVLGVDDDDED